MPSARMARRRAWVALGNPLQYLGELLVTLMQ